MERVICLLFGYGFGLLQTGYLYGRINHIDIRQHGSGNSGTTNALRVLGKRAGIVVFLGDFLKTYVPCMLVWFLLRNQVDIRQLCILYTGFGVILGHNYPFYLKFQGGKGIAATAGLVTAIDVRVAFVCMVAFIVVVAITKFVSLGSLFVAAIFFIGILFFGSKGDYGLSLSATTEFFILAGMICLMAFWRHRANIKRLIQGTENKLGAKKI